MIKDGPWMQTSLGNKFFPGSFDPEQVRYKEIAQGLAKLCRYSGQGHVDLHYSVAEHCVHLVDYVDAFVPDASQKMKLALLLHDAHEYIAGDPTPMVKLWLGDVYTEFIDRWQNVITAKYGVREVASMHHQWIHELDKRILANEKAKVFDIDLYWESLEGLEPLLGVSIQCWQPREAMNRWLAWFYELYPEHYLEDLKHRDGSRDTLVDLHDKMEGS